jgi:hypothetical protein
MCVVCSVARTLLTANCATVLDVFGFTDQMRFCWREREGASTHFFSPPCLARAAMAHPLPSEMFDIDHVLQEACDYAADALGASTASAPASAPQVPHALQKAPPPRTIDYHLVTRRPTRAEARAYVLKYLADEFKTSEENLSPEILLRCGDKRCNRARGSVVTNVQLAIDAIIGHCKRHDLPSKKGKVASVSAAAAGLPSASSASSLLQTSKKRKERDDFRSDSEEEDASPSPSDSSSSSSEFENANEQILPDKRHRVFYRAKPFAKKTQSKSAGKQAKRSSAAADPEDDDDDGENEVNAAAHAAVASARASARASVPASVSASAFASAFASAPAAVSAPAATALFPPYTWYSGDDDVAAIRSATLFSGLPQFHAPKAAPVYVAALLLLSPIWVVCCGSSRAWDACRKPTTFSLVGIPRPMCTDNFKSYSMACWTRWKPPLPPPRLLRRTELGLLL